MITNLKAAVMMIAILANLCLFFYTIYITTTRDTEYLLEMKDQINKTKDKVNIILDITHKNNAVASELERRIEELEKNSTPKRRKNDKT